MVTPEPIEELRALLRRRFPSARLSVDAPRDASGTWWLDIRVSGRMRQISWSPQFGFGLYDDDVGYGDRPAKITKSPAQAMAALDFAATPAESLAGAVLSKKG